MTIKALLLDDTGTAIGPDQWREKREDIVARLFNTLGQPPVARNTRDIETLSEEKLAAYTRRKIRYVVGESDSIPAYLLIPHQIERPTPAVVAMHQIGPGKDEVAGLDGDSDFAYGHGPAPSSPANWVSPPSSAVATPPYASRPAIGCVWTAGKA